MSRRPVLLRRRLAAALRQAARDDQLDQRAQHVVDARGADAGDREDILAARFLQRLALARGRARLNAVDLVRREDLRLVLEAVAVSFDLAADGLVGLRDLALGAVDEVQDR